MKSQAKLNTDILSDGLQNLNDSSNILDAAELEINNQNKIIMNAIITTQKINNELHKTSWILSGMQSIWGFIKNLFIKPTSLPLFKINNNVPTHIQYNQKTFLFESNISSHKELKLYHEINDKIIIIKNQAHNIHDSLEQSITFINKFEKENDKTKQQMKKVVKKLLSYNKL